MARDYRAGEGLSGAGRGADGCRARPRSGSPAESAARAGEAAARSGERSTRGTPARAAGERSEPGPARGPGARNSDGVGTVAAVASCFVGLFPAKSARGVPESRREEGRRKPMTARRMRRNHAADRPEGQAAFWHIEVFREPKKARKKASERGAGGAPLSLVRKRTAFRPPSSSWRSRPSTRPRWRSSGSGL